jgi:hypothetical protein
VTAVVERAFAVASVAFSRAPHDDGLAHPFGFDQHPPHRWRVSRDTWEALVDYAGTGDRKGPSPDAQLLGEPIELDESLPPDSMLLEPVRESMTP